LISNPDGNILSLESLTARIDVNPDDRGHRTKISPPHAQRASLEDSNFKDRRSLVAPLTEISLINGEVMMPLEHRVLLVQAEVLPQIHDVFPLVQ
jgi:hypothetical protein